MLNKSPNTYPGWETVRLIGRGDFGAVYEIQRTFFGTVEKAALKVISIPQNSSDIAELYGDGYDTESITSAFQSHLESIMAEYMLMRKLSGCTNIVGCDDTRYIQHDDGIGWDIYIKMELLTPLTQALPETIPEETVRKLAKDMCTALELCREQNIIHRDIKPQNIFVSARGDYKLGDFGIAKTVEKTMGGTKVGTYRYMAPEVYNNQPYGTAADIYSLGLVLYWMLNERRMPFMPLPPEKLKTGMDETARQRRFSGEQLPPPAHGSEALKRVVLKACAYDPKDRYASAAEMLEDLEDPKKAEEEARRRREEEERKRQEEARRRREEEEHKRQEEERRRLEAERKRKEEEELRRLEEEKRRQSQPQTQTGGTKYRNIAIAALVIALAIALFSLLQKQDTPANAGNSAQQPANNSSVSETAAPNSPATEQEDPEALQNQTRAETLEKAAALAAQENYGAAMGLLMQAMEKDDYAPYQTAYTAYAELYAEQQKPAPQIQMSAITRVEASSSLRQDYQGGILEHSPDRLIDGQQRTGWVEGKEGSGAGETVTLYFDGEYTVSQIMIYAGYQLDERRYYGNARPKDIALFFSDGTYYLFSLEDSFSAQTLTFEAVETEYLTLRIDSVYYGNEDDTDTVISEILLY